MDEIEIGDLDRAELLAALHNNTRPMGMGFLNARGDVTADDVRYLIPPETEDASFDYVFGRPIKVTFTKTGKLTRAWLYDRDTSPGACQRVVDTVRKARGE